MAKVKLKDGADVLQVTEELNNMGITVGQKLPNGQLVAYINQRTFLARLYPDLIPVFQEDRRFWKSVRARTRAGEEVPKSEIEAHAKEYQRKFNEIIRRQTKIRL